MPRVRPALHLSLIALGLASVVYGTASLTGGWLGTPPWWTNPTTPRDEVDVEAAWDLVYHRASGQRPTKRFADFTFDSSRPGTAGSAWPGNGWRFLSPDVKTQYATAFEELQSRPSRRPGRAWISAGVVAAGLALAAFGAWPRRRRIPA
jgi:hypothetical protein